ncbi:methyl-accepting chemotaxis protein [Erwinia psidii]|uniref:HAMP domain-containing protein n=1 Tax=Erwinia psidii TaxID=69224 RepID=A0A3N6SDR2_9GAMM|nr:methyl-accepting chemotaxis protein [Erwinia psidii]MCX8958248.1 HAMP domain-containing protein [Erwinia psidii]MCX8962390.1 HAMP domain-containing protein [Erwinia psidii]MCX8965174.1 HAMP domain-containing protein [Erwinia psidii]RQM38023.1 HAMP domain-containing protein [Erwinia psidii]
MLKKVSIRTGLLVLLALMTMMLLVVSVMGIIAINKGNRSLDVVNRIQGVELNSLLLTNNNLLYARAAAALSIRKMEIGLPNESRAVYGQASTYIAASHEEMKKFVDAGTVTAHGKMLADAIIAAYEKYMAEGIQPMMAAVQREDPDSYYSLLEGKLAPLNIALSKTVNEFKFFADQVTNARLEEAARNQQILTLLIVCCGILTVILLSASWVLLRVILLTPLDSAIEHLEFVAAGDLTQILPDSGKNELGRLNSALAEMQMSLQQSVSRVRDASIQIDTGSRELSFGNLNLSQRTEESAASLEQTAASMEQLTATVKLNAENASQAHELAQSVSESAERGSTVVNYVMEKMQEITHSSRRIGDILGVIDGIAFQTNILALNASVEAARAGEQGRGFAVVASEVRNLAQRSATAAKEIRELIGESEIRVTEGSQMATKAGDTMHEIASEVMRVTSLMKEISSASQEQSKGIEQVNLAVTQMDEVAQQNAALVEQAAAATQSLEEQSQQLVQSMAVFKVSLA